MDQTKCSFSKNLLGKVAIFCKGVGILEVNSLTEMTRGGIAVASLPVWFAFEGVLSLPDSCGGTQTKKGPFGAL